MANVHDQIRGSVLYQLSSRTLALQVIVLEERIGTVDGSEFSCLAGSTKIHTFFRGFPGKAVNMWGSINPQQFYICGS